MASVLIGEEQVNQILNRGVAEVIDREHLRAALSSGRKLRVKLGIDPTAPDLHLGHSVVLRKLRQFQDLGHQAVLVIGDFTAQIGDPTGRSVERKMLTAKEIKENIKTYLKQAGKIVNLRTLEIRYNSEWLKKNALETILSLARAGSIQQVLHRADFKKRLAEGNDISLLETMYPLFQGYDSVQLKSDVELGGIDQTFNVLMGRRIQRHFGQAEQDVLMVPLLVGTDGADKMSKSKGNYIAVTESAESMYGKVMAVKDELVLSYFELCTDISKDEIAALPKNPRELKLRLAVEITTLYHGAKAAEAAKQNFIEVFTNKGMPKDIPTVTIQSHGATLVELLVEADLVTSKSEARRLIEQGGVKINEMKKTNPTETIAVENGMIVQVGPRRFVRIVRR